ncbi:MAG: amidohydrolase family protein [Planctomycetaceae bacterium]
MRIDAHQHFWRYAPAEYPWIGAGMERLARDFLPGDLADVARPHGIGGSVAVQARQSLVETRWLLELAAADPFVRGVVGWVDLRDPGVASTLEPLSRRERFVGVRHVVQDEPDPRFLLGANFVRGLGHLHAFGLTYDLLLFPPQLPAAVELVGLLPEQPFVLDHLSKPRIALGPSAPEFASWRREIEALARHPNVSCKLSGLVTEAAWCRWRREDFTPYLDVALAAFRPDRLMFGSDWPVCLLSGDYAAVVDIVTTFIGKLAEGEREAILGGTAARFYGLA